MKAPNFDAKVTRLARMREFLGLKRNIVVLLAALLIVGMGEQLWDGFTPRYLQGLGAGALVIGLYGTLTDLTEAVKTAVINKRAGGMGLISGRKAFQRPMAEGVQLLNAIQDVYLDPAVDIA